ncbi:MAG: hypothetical protein ABR962_03400 [Candidatus Bathyarchaeia archaeon]
MTKFAKYNPRESTLKEALNALRRSHEAGLVHMAYMMKGNDRPTLICSCCPCCCHTLGGLLRHGIATQILTSKFVAGKQTCERRLSFAAFASMTTQNVFKACLKRFKGELMFHKIDVTRS